MQKCIHYIYLEDLRYKEGMGVVSVIGGELWYDVTFNNLVSIR